MPVGFQSFKSDGTLQFDSTSVFCMTLKDKQTVTSNITFSDISAQAYDIVVTGTTPIIAVRSTGSISTALVGVTKVSSTWTFRVITFGAGSQDFTYYVFDRPDASASNSAGFGLEVLDESGSLVWSASQKSLRLMFNNDLNNLPSGRTYAHIGSAIFDATWDNVTEDGIVFFTNWNIYASKLYTCTSTGISISTDVSIGSGTSSGANSGPIAFGSGTGLDGAGYQNTEVFAVDVTHF